MKIQKLLAVAGLASVFGLAAWLTRAFNGSSVDESSRGKRTSITPVKVNAGSTPASLTPLPAAGISKTELNELKQMLLNYNSKSNGWISPEFQAFVDDSVNRLHFTGELLELAQLIESNNLKFAEVAFDKSVKALLSSAGSSEARRKLIATVADRRWATLASRWCLYAGQGCSASEFASYAGELTDKSLRGHLEFGRNLSLVESNPVSAVSSMVSYLIDSALREHALSILPDVINKLPMDSNFAELERLLPTKGRNSCDLGLSVEHLLVRWGEADPAAAANYVAQNPERISPSMMSSVLQCFSEAHPVEALDWVLDFPRGPYFDAAAATVVAQLGDQYPDTAKELLEQIVDPEVRKRATEDLAGFGPPTPK